MITRILDWLGDIMPYRCPRCGYWGQRKDMPSVQHRVAGWVQVCRTCFDELYGDSYWR